MNRIKLELPELNFAATEALNRLRINIRFVGVNTRRIMITSSQENEGKSTVSVNLWRMMAEAGFKTAFLDLDLRKSVIGSKYGITGEEQLFGIEHYLSGQCEIDQIICQTNIENGWMIPCTDTIENPSFLFEGERFTGLLDRLSQDFRYVIIDTPPLLAVADGCQIASCCDASILVVNRGVTSKKHVRQSIQQLNTVGCPILGVVLNHAVSGGKHYYYSKKHHHSNNSNT